MDKKVERYNFLLDLNGDTCQLRMYYCEEGEHVSVEDYEKLEKEFADYKEEVQTIRNFVDLVKRAKLR